MRKHAVRLGAGGLGCCIVLAGLPALADDAGNIEQVVISANRVATAADQVGSSVTVIEAKDLEAKQAVTLQDALQDIPGLYVYESGSAAYKTNIKLRGFDSGRIAIIIDGVKIDNQASGMYDRPINQLQASDIERIEVLRGNQSSLYGSDAIGGAILITTKSGRDTKGLLEGEAGAEVGSFVTRRGTLNVRGHYQDVYYKAALSDYVTHGYDMTDFDSGSKGSSEADGSKNYAYNFKVGADVLRDAGALDLLNLEGSFGLFRGSAEYDSRGGEAGLDPLMRQDTRTGRLAATADLFDGMLSNLFAVERMTAHIVPTHDRSNATGTYKSGSTTYAQTSHYWGDTTKYEYQGTFRPVENQTLVFGADQTRDHYLTHGYVSTKTPNQGGALINSSFFSDYSVALLDKRLSLSLGGRLDEHDTYGDHTTWRTTASYRIPSTGTRFHTSYGTGYKAPILAQLYHPTAGNLDLKPEESTGYDAGVEQKLLDRRLTLDVTWFKTNMTNEIEKVGSIGGKYYNVGSSRHMGVESSATWAIDREWDVSLSHTYELSRDNSTDTVLEEAPRHSLSVRVDYKPAAVEGLSTWVRARANSGSYSDSSWSGAYTVWSFGSDYAINPAVDVYGRVENLFDKDYTTMYGYTASPVAAYAGVRLKF